MILKGYLFTFGYLFLVFIIAFMLYKYNKKTLTRKFVHISVSFCYVIFYIYFKNSYHIIIPPAIFVILNYLSYKKDLFKPMEEDSSLGTVYYAISVLFMCIVTYINKDFYYAFGIALFIMAFGDGFASIIGKRFKSKKIYKNKTLYGSLTVFIISMLVIFIFKLIFNLNYDIIDIIVVGLISSFVELISQNGLDNILLPTILFIIVYFLGVV